MKASFPPFASCFPPWSGFASPRRFHRRATGAIVGRGNQTRQLAIVGERNHQKASLKREPEYRPCQWQNRAGAGSMRQRVFEQYFAQIRLCRIANKVSSRSETDEGEHSAWQAKDGCRQAKKEHYVLSEPRLCQVAPRWLIIPVFT